MSAGIIKSSPQDFIVEEHLSFPLSGEGEHAYLQIQKTGANTHWVARQLARQLGCTLRDVGYAGLKDRHAVTTQWFSVPARLVTDSALAKLHIEGVEILHATRHRGKLRRGAIRANHFQIVIREVTVDETALRDRISFIQQTGVPNYFGEQRFGHQRQNLLAVDAYFKNRTRIDKQKRSIYLSAARAWLFNHVLATRVEQHTWVTALEGDVFVLAGSKRFFSEETITAEIIQRVAEGDIHPSGPLYGDGDNISRAVVRDLENDILQQWPAWLEGLKAARLKPDRRALRVIPENLLYELDNQRKTLTLRFDLPTGSYATGVIRELVDVSGGDLELADE